MAGTLVDSSSITTPVGATGSLSMLDKKLLRYASRRLTLEQMSVKLGGILSAAECGQRVREILSSWDWMAITEQRALILMDFIELKEILFDRIRREGGMIEDSEGRVSYSFGDPRWATALTNVLKEMNKLISSEQASVEADTMAIRRGHARVMGQAIELALTTVVHGLQQSYPEIDPMDARAQLELALPRAIEKIELSVVDDDKIAVEDDEGGF